MDLVSHILKYASLHRTAKINNLLKAPRFDNLKSDFDLRSRAALELMPLLLLGQNKSVKEPRHFIDCRERISENFITPSSGLMPEATRRSYKGLHLTQPVLQLPNQGRETNKQGLYR
ncbi:hypothetical protein OUZ56_009663 [Daphnia magna]|uniref:Uncharacterized protein n=1 Tax=Daphnia magna TaxID=35525 RepID=A0ABR0AGS6_9CRUS|nr:hypothetical protein OUZ56_009663 [Daphnia magna]